MKQDLTEIAVVLDESGSMGSVRNDAIGGYNTFIEEQKKVPGDANLTLVKFNSVAEVVCEGVKMSTAKDEVLNLNERSYIPSGNTALYDAVGMAINKIGKRLADTPEDERAAKVIVAILTDGEENASQEFSAEQIKTMIEHQQTKYSWQFIFLAANQDAVLAGSEIGIKVDNCMSYMSTGKGTRSAYKTMSKTITSFRSSN